MLLLRNSDLYYRMCPGGGKVGVRRVGYVDGGKGVISREDFIFTIGFSGNTGIVDARQKRQYSRMSTAELAVKKAFRAALCSAVYADSREEMESVLDAYNEDNAHPVDSVDHLQRLFGVFEVPDTIGRIKAL